MVQIAWSTPLTAVSNAALTAAQWNASVRDNLLQTAPGLATAAGQIFVATGANAIAARVPTTASDTASDTTTATSYGNLSGSSGPSVTVTTGAKAIVMLSALLQGSAAGVEAVAGYDVSGASTISATDDEAIRFTAYTTNARGRGSLISMPTLTAGSNTFTYKYKTSSGSSLFDDKKITVFPL